MAKKVNKNGSRYLEDLINAAKAAVVGYEKYLLDKIDYKELASIMTSLRKSLPFKESESED